MKRKIIGMILVLLMSVSAFSKSTDELIDIIADNSMKIQYYFWIKDSKAFLAAKNTDATYGVWYFTSDRKWQPIHNSGAYDGFSAVTKSFSKVDLDLEGGKITFSSLTDNYNKDVESLVKILENKTVQIQYYFWLADKEAFLFTKDGEFDVKIWNFTDSRKWKPIHNAKAFDGYPEAKLRLSNIDFDPSKNSLDVGHTVSAYDLLNIGFSNIPYLRSNHNNYSNKGSSLNPAPTKNAVDKSINWSIDAKSVEDAKILEEHIKYMTSKLKEGETPRAFDRLYLMEAYMKQNKKYTTSITRNDKNVIIKKVANDTCAYDVISAHSDGVSGDFFGKGDIMNDYSSIADRILASSSCDGDRESITAFITSKQFNRGNHNGGGRYGGNFNNRR